MKTMTCNQLDGACEKEFHAETFEEIAKLSKEHGIEMHKKDDEDHVKAMHNMKKQMKDPEAMKEWYENKAKEFDTLPSK